MTCLMKVFTFAGIRLNSVNDRLFAGNFSCQSISHFKKEISLFAGRDEEGLWRSPSAPAKQLLV